jgi:multiple antibiotic resistance protein
MCIILLTTLFVGALVLKFFGITLPVLRIGGGLVIARIGFAMLESRQEASRSGPGQESDSMLDVALTPVAMPMLSGPGSIALVIAMATEATSVVAYTAIGTGIALVACLAWITLHFSVAIVRFVGDSGMQALTRMMGLLLVCIGIQFVITGILEGLTGEVMTALLRDWMDALRAPG